MSEETRDVLDIEPGLSRWVDDSKLYEEADVERLKAEVRRLREALRDLIHGVEQVEDWGDVLPDVMPRARSFLPPTGDSDDQ